MPSRADSAVVDSSVDSATAPDAPPDSADAGPCPGLTECATVCVDVDTDVAHCGACGNACLAPMNGVATCVAGTCGLVCAAGYVDVAGACLLAPRLTYPPSGSTVATARPTLRWVLPAGFPTAVVQLCAERDCATVLETIMATGEMGQPASPLAPGLVFWHATTGGRQSATWAFTVPMRDRGLDVGYGRMPDYNGDGRGDVVVGAPFVAMNEGRVYAFLNGAAGVPTGATSIHRSPATTAAAEFGLSIASAGDLDGDGYADVAVGAPRAAGSEGLVAIYLGGPGGLSETPHQVLRPTAGSTGLFGSDVAAAGDVDGDGYGDLLVGALGEGITPGRVYVYMGGATGVVEPAGRGLTGAGRFGSAVAGVGDLDGDGFADIAIGAPAADSNTGEVRVYLGDATGVPGTPQHIIAGPTGALGRFGAAISGPGDLNGDGYADLAVAAPDVGSLAGRVLVYYGGPMGLGTAADVTLDAPGSAGSNFGFALEVFGDANRDGFDDLAVGAFGVNARAGRVTVFLGSATGLNFTNSTSVGGPFGTAGDFGRSLGPAGDVDGNGGADLAVGSPGVDMRSGRTYVYRGGARGLSMAPPVVLPGPSGGAFGRAVAN